MIDLKDHVILKIGHCESGIFKAKMLLISALLFALHFTLIYSKCTGGNVVTCQAKDLDYNDVDLLAGADILVLEDHGQLDEGERPQGAPTDQWPPGFFDLVLKR